MSNRLSKGMLVMVSLALMSMPISALGDKPTPPQPPPSSCTAVGYAMLSTYTASPGLNVGVFGKVTNCASGRKRLTVVMSSTSACGVETIISSNRIALGGGQTVLVSSSYAIAPDTCLGAMEVNINLYDGSTLLGGASTTLMMQ